MSQQEVVVTTKNTGSLTLGIVAIVIGVLALLGGWVPFLGLLAIPFALIGALLAGVGLLLAMVKGFKGAGMPLLGGAICVAAMILPMVMTGSTSVAIAESADEVARELEAKRQALREERAREKEQEDSLKAGYITQNLELYDLSARYMESVLDGRVPGVLFK